MGKQSQPHQRPSTVFDLDAIFSELGEFGRYQRLVYLYICLAIVAYGHMTLSYVFTAGDLNYRCRIPDQDIDVVGSSTPSYWARWLPQYIPYDSNGRLAKCLQFVVNQGDVSGNGSEPIACTEFVYEKTEQNILTEFSLQCSANDWKRTIVGSVNNAALFIGLPIVGLLSDRYGRKKVFIWGLFGCGVAGILKSFSTNYWMFLLFEFLDSGIGSGTFMGGFVLGMELVGPSKRTLGGTFIMCCFSIGAVLLGTHASWTNHFRVLLRVCYAPALLVVSYFWLIPESSRWLMSSGHKREGAENILEAARVNGVVLREDTLQRLHDHCNEVSNDLSTVGPFKADEQKAEVRIYHSKVLMLRTVSCCFCWLVNAFVAYGLTLNSVELAGSKYTNFILMNAVEVPAYIATYFLTKHVGRRWSLCGMMLLAGCSCFCSLLIPDNLSSTAAMLRLPFFLLGKFAITASFHVLYVYTTEIFPTGMRNGMMSTCSMIGRLGSMLAPQTPLLERYIPSLPLMMYSSSAILSGLMVLQFPETFNTKLPDTLEEALNIGKREKGKAKQNMPL